MNVERTHREIGTRSKENNRLINQLQLQSLTPNISFFPQLVNFTSFDGENGYVKGTPFSNNESIILNF